ncbi:hypothetical protein P7C70_g8566, partial [Phenoliferia sp. Uapishka_3]
MNTISEMQQEGLLTKMGPNGRSIPITFDAVFRVADAPQITKDTLSKDAGYVLFGLRTSSLHLDVPIPDPPAYGSNGNYVWPNASALVPWDQKIPQLVFRGAASFAFGVDNWYSTTRIKLAQLSKEYPKLIDAGVTSFRPAPLQGATGDLGSGKVLFQTPTSADIQASTLVNVSLPMTFEVQSQYRYILDVDGGLGSSRRLGLLSSGSGNERRARKAADPFPTLVVLFEEGIIAFVASEDKDVDFMKSAVNLTESATDDYPVN